MNAFDQKQIQSGAEHIAEMLKNARKGLDLSLKDAAKQTGIRLAYLEALENGELNKLPAGVYGKNYLREYALLLHIDPKPLLESFDQEANAKNDTKDKMFIERARHTQFFLAIPKIFKFLVVLFSVSLLVMYLVFYLRNLTEAPYLEIINPPGDITISSTSIMIVGKSEIETEIRINDEIVLSNELGEFELEIFLKKGLNTITISSQKKYSQPSIINRKILVE
jgi:transcriptional regulator with XRE-family HTH domain